MDYCTTMRTLIGTSTLLIRCKINTCVVSAIITVIPCRALWDRYTICIHVNSVAKDAASQQAQNYPTMAACTYLCMSQLMLLS